jgi:hypothetical protein
VTGPVIASARNEAGETDWLGWCESERDYYTHGAAIEVKFEHSVNLWWSRSLRLHSRPLGAAAARAFRWLTNSPSADAYQFATHVLPEPGAPLEPIEGRAA